MCGRYIANTEAEIMEIREILSRISIRLSLNLTDDPEETDDIYPTQKAPVIMLYDNSIVMEKIKWGFEKWDSKGIIINARSETVTKSRFFSRYVKNQRCIIPAHGYYEWKTMPDKTKIKYEFTNNKSDGIFMAGLYRQNNGGNEFVILTKNAAQSLEIIHDRMPLMIEPGQIENWLNGSLLINDLYLNQNNIEFREAV